jgi:hypothetical protein
MNEEQFEQLLAKTLKRREPTQVGVDRVLKRLAGPLPRQRFAWRRLPDILLDWQFAPAWPRMAALACCAVLGFFIGMAGVDRQFGNPPGYVAGGGGIGTLTFDPDPIVGGRP